MVEKKNDILKEKKKLQHNILLLQFPMVFANWRVDCGFNRVWIMKTVYVHTVFWTRINCWITGIQSLA